MNLKIISFMNFLGFFIEWDKKNYKFRSLKIGRIKKKNI